MTDMREAKRADMVLGLMRLAEMLQRTNVPLPYDLQVNVYYGTTEQGGLGEWMTQDDARKAMTESPGDWHKSYDAYVSYTKQLSDYVTYDINVPRDRVCRQVQTGTRQVPAVEAVPAHEEPVFEWVCDDEQD